MRPPVHPRPIAPVTLFLVAWLGGGCTQSLLPVSGLKPIDPPAVTGWPTVTSTQPTLRWAALPPHSKDGGISHVRYELRIWREDHGRPVALVYRRRDLEITTHTLEDALRPASNYYWTVRARFQLNGEGRVSPWSRI